MKKKASMIFDVNLYSRVGILAHCCLPSILYFVFLD
jgi:hypothetical protein